MKLKSMLLSAGALLVLSAHAGLENLTGQFCNGQLFLQWKESNLAPDTRLSVWSSDAPITKENLGKAVKVASMLNLQSARDWWLNADNFVIKRSKKAKGEEIFAGNVADTGAKKNTEKGFVISDGGKSISPDGGLHVHTPWKEVTGKRYYAVAAHKGASEKVIDLAATTAPIKVTVGKSAPIRIKGNLKRNSAKGLPLIISLHGRGGGVGVNKKGKPVGTHIIYSDRNFAWREGIPFKFSAGIRRDKVLTISLNDRVWIGRKLNKKESTDSRDYVPAISTFWMGYNVNIAHSNEGPKFVWDNYTERYILHIIKWAQEYLGADVNRTYITGGSMGGSGTVQMVTHFPEVFAAGRAQVPLYSYGWKIFGTKGRGSAWRLTCSIGQFTADNPALTPDGRDLVDYSNGAKNISNSAIDMPPLLATNGRRDASIPWVNNPDFYRGANEGRQMFQVYWNNGNHGMSRQCPRDFITEKDMLRYRLNESFPAFSNCSDNKNYGNGSFKDGDLTGWINRGTDWKVIADTPDRYEIDLSIGYKGIKYPVTSDVTIRRRQQFKPAAGTTVCVEINGKKQNVVIDKNGLLTIEKISFADKKPVKVICTIK